MRNHNKILHINVNACFLSQVQQKTYDFPDNTGNNVNSDGKEKMEIQIQSNGVAFSEILFQMVLFLNGNLPFTFHS